VGLVTWWVGLVIWWVCFVYWSMGLGPWLVNLVLVLYSGFCYVVRGSRPIVTYLTTVMNATCHDGNRCVHCAGLVLLGWVPLGGAPRYLMSGSCLTYPTVLIV